MADDIVAKIDEVLSGVSPALENPALVDQHLVNYQLIKNDWIFFRSCYRLLREAKEEINRLRQANQEQQAG